LEEDLLDCQERLL
jgi:FtsZ-binding cell division protein ZapB